MSRTLTAKELAAIQAQRGEIIHLLDLVFSGGTVRFTTGPQNIVWNSNTYYASGGAMTFDAATETVDTSGQRLRLTLDGVNLTAITYLLSMNYIGRLSTLRRAHLNSVGEIIADPIVLFVGYLNAPWEIKEDPDNRWATVNTELVSPLAIFDQMRGIAADPNSHQRFYAGDTFFSHIAGKSEGDFGFGPSYGLGWLDRAGHF